ncbi:hypothetical protein F4778DRAFT_723877 [Xylariomycetidae sp. FL2044]|nr:hypothetical protein F4778DRAFT_723877 [Xylariomycetidae sp. FL2044]
MATEAEQEISDIISDLIDRKIRLVLNRHVNTFSTGSDVASLMAKPRIQNQRKRLKAEVAQLIASHERSIRDTATKFLVHIDPEDGSLVVTGTQEPGNGTDSPPGLGRHTPLRDHHRQLQPPSAMARKFLSAPDDEDFQHPNAGALLTLERREREGKQSYFFYGSLMDPKTLQKVLGLEERPQLRSGRVYGYYMKMWGPYPALLDGAPGNVVAGMVFDVEGVAKKERLAEYETGNYRENSCYIELEGGTGVHGMTFLWAGDEGELKDGSFDLKDWQMEHVLDGI